MEEKMTNMAHIETFKPSTINTYISSIAQTLESYNINPKALFAKVGLDYQYVIQNPDARIDLETVAKLWQESVTRTGDTCFGLNVGENVGPTTFHALGYAFFASPNMYEGLKRVCRFFQVASDGAKFTMEEKRGSCILYFDPYTDFRHMPLEAFDSFLTAADKYTRMVTNQGMKVEGIELIRSKPHGKVDFEERLGCHIRFGGKHNRLFISKSELMRPIPSANAELAHYNDQIIIDYMQRYYPSNIVSLIQNKVVGLLESGKPTLERLSKELGMSRRNINRHLELEQTSFQEILISVRKELANRYLDRVNLSVTEIAFMLGYTDSSNFSRAYRKWFGISPKAYREHLEISVQA